MFQKRPANAFASHGIIDKKIFQIDSRPPAKGGIIVEPKRKARRFPVPESEIAIGPRRGPEKAFTNITDRGSNFVAQALIVGKLADVIKDELSIARNRLPDEQAHCGNDSRI